MTSEKYAIVAFNPDGTENFLDWSNDFDELWKKKNGYQRKERQSWLKGGGEYKVIEIIDYAPHHKTKEKGSSPTEAKE